MFRDKLQNFLFSFIAVVLVASGVLKSFNIYSFANEIALFADGYSMPSLIILWRTPIAIFICVFEMTLGAYSLLNHRFRKCIVWLFFFVFSAFLCLTGANYLFPPENGSVESCGCFGDFIPMNALGSFIKSIVLWIICIYLLINYRMNALAANNATIKRHSIRLFIMLVISLFLPIYSFLFINEIDKTLYSCIFVTISLFVIILAYLICQNGKLPH